MASFYKKEAVDKLKEDISDILNGILDGPELDKKIESKVRRAQTIADKELKIIEKE